MRFVAIIALVGVTSAGPAFAHEGDMIEFPEFNLRIKTDISDKGPARGAPMFLPAGMQMMGDQAFLIFSAPAEISAFIKTNCGAP